jgi:hypothetical protein
MARKAQEAEKEIAKLNKEKDKLEAEMAKPEVYSVPAKIKAAKEAYNKIMRALEEQETLWLEMQPAPEKAVN